MIETFRDIVIIILGFMGIVATLLFTVMAILLFRKVGALLDSTRGTVGDIRNTASFISEVAVRPVIYTASVLRGVRAGIGIMARLSGRKGEDG